MIPTRVIHSFGSLVFLPVFFPVFNTFVKTHDGLLVYHQIVIGRSLPVSREYSNASHSPASPESLL